MKFRLKYYQSNYQSNYYVAQVKSLFGWKNITITSPYGKIDKKGNKTPTRDFPLLFADTELEKAKNLLNSWNHSPAIYTENQIYENKKYEELMNIYKKTTYLPDIINIP